MSDEWVATTLGEVALINPDKTPKWAADEEIRYVDIASVSKEVGVNLSSVNTMTFGEAPGRARRLIRSGDVLVSTVRPNLRAFAQVPDELDGQVASTGFAVLRGSERVLSGFLWAVTQTDDFVNAMVSKCTGTNYPAIRPADIATYEVRLPPVPVQRRIVDLMTHLDAHIANLRAEQGALESTVGLLRALLIADGESVPLSSLAAQDGIQIGPFGSQLHASDYSDDGVPVVMPRDIIEGVINEKSIKRVPPEVVARLQRHRVKAGDIVFPRRGDLSKRALVTIEQEGWLCGTGCIRFRPHPDVDAEQVYQSISGDAVTNWLIEHAVGTTMLNLNSQIVGALPVVVPTDASAPVADATRAVTDSIERLAVEAAALATLRGEVLSALLSGTVLLDDGYDALLRKAA